VIARGSQLQRLNRIGSGFVEEKKEEGIGDQSSVGQKKIIP